MKTTMTILVALALAPLMYVANMKMFEQLHEGTWKSGVILGAALLGGVWGVASKLNEAKTARR